MSSTNQPQDVLRDHAHVGPLDTEFEQIAFEIFAFRFPQSTYYDNHCHAERSECRRIALHMVKRLAVLHEHSWAIPSGQGIDEKWRQLFVATQIGNALSEMAAGVPFKSLDVADRTWVRQQAEQLVEDAVKRFSGPIDTGENYQPELEPEWNFDGHTEKDQNS